MKWLNNRSVFLLIILWMIVTLACTQPLAGLLGASDQVVEDDPTLIAQATIELQTDVRNTLGDLDQDRATVVISQNTFDKDTTLTMAYLSEPPGDGANQFTPLGPTVVLKTDGEQTRFNEPVRISLKFDPGMVNGPGDVYAAYYHEVYGWHYFKPDQVDMEQGVMHFTTYHFSWWGAAQPTDEEIIDKFVSNQSTEQFVRQTHQDLANQQVEEMVRQIMKEGMGVHDNRTIEIITRAVLKEAPLGIGKIGIAIYDNKPDDLFNVTLEETAKALGNALKDGVVADIAKEAGTVGAFASAAGAYAEGDYEGALKIMANEIANNLPLVSQVKKVGEAAAAVVDHWVQDLWKAPALEKAYEVYASGHDKYGYDGVEAGDFNQVLQQMGGGLESRVRIDYVNEYCARRGCDVSQLSVSERLAIGDQGIEALRQNWEARYERQMEISAIKEKNMALLELLDERNLLKLDRQNPMYTGNEDLEMMLNRLNNMTERIMNDLGRNDLVTDHFEWTTTDPNNRDNMIPAGVLAELVYTYHNRRLNENPALYDELINQIGIRLENNEGLSVLEIMDLAEELAQKDAAGLLDSDKDLDDDVDEVDEADEADDLDEVDDEDDLLVDESEDEMSDPSVQDAPQELNIDSSDLEVDDPETDSDYEWDETNQCWQYVGPQIQNQTWNCQSQCFDYRDENWHYDCTTDCSVFVGTGSDRWSWNCATDCWDYHGPDSDRFSWNCATDCWQYIGTNADCWSWNCSTNCWEYTCAHYTYNCSTRCLEYTGADSHLWSYDCANKCLQYIGPPVEGYEWSCSGHRWNPVKSDD